MSKDTRTRVFIEVYIDNRNPIECASLAAEIAKEVEKKYGFIAKYSSQQPLSFCEKNRMDEEIELLKYPSNLK